MGRAVQGELEQGGTTDPEQLGASVDVERRQW
jgi:hypothetical protein